jgi:hypothetical protein
MNLQKMISELRAEKSRLDDAILALERLSVTHPKRRGRPPQWLKERMIASEEEATSRPEAAAVARA